MALYLFYYVYKNKCQIDFAFNFIFEFSANYENIKQKKQKNIRFVILCCFVRKFIKFLKRKNKKILNNEF